MPSRDILHKSKLDAVKEWLDSQGIPHRPGRGDYDVLQVQVAAPEWFCIFDRLSAKEHYTVDKRLVRTVIRFIQAARRA